MKKVMKSVLFLALIVAFTIPCMAVTAYTNAVGGATGLPVATKGATYKLTGQIDFSTEPLAVAGDSMLVIKIPANTMVLGVRMEVVKAPTTAVTVSVGDSASATQYTGAVVVSNVANTVSAYTTIKGYTAANGIVATTGTAASGSTGIIRFIATVMDLK